jgi:predicted MFS family arabinose efflux permease
MATPDWRTGTSLLHDTGFARLFTARMVTAFGSAMTPVALPFVILDDLNGDGSDVGVVLAWGALAQVVTLLFAGVFADRGSRKQQLVGADLLAAAAQATLAALVLSGRASIHSAAALNAVSGVAFALHFPAAAGLVPLVVPRERSRAANALLSIAQASALALGASAGGLIAATAGPGVALAIDAATFGASGLLVAGIRAAAQPRAVRATLLGDVAAGFREFTAHSWLWSMVLQFTVLLMGWFGAWAVIGPVVAKTALGGAASWGWIVGAHGLGRITGGSIALRMHFTRPMLVGALCCLPSALVPLLLIGPATVALLIAAAFLAGTGFAIFGVLWSTSLQLRIAPEALSRVSSYDVLGSIAMIPVGEALAGWGVEHAGPQTSLLCCVAAIVIPTLAVLCVRDVRQLPAVDLDGNAA